MRPSESAWAASLSAGRPVTAGAVIASRRILTVLLGVTAAVATAPAAGADTVAYLVNVTVRPG